MAASGPAGWAQYVVPSGHRAIVKAITMINLGDVAALVQVAVGSIYVAYVPNLAAGQAIQQAHYQVVYAGADMQVYRSSSIIQVAVSGYLFADTTGRRAPPPGASTKPTDDPWRPPAEQLPA